MRHPGQSIEGHPQVSGSDGSIVACKRVQIIRAYPFQEKSVDTFVLSDIIPKSVGYSHFCRNMTCSCSMCHLYEFEKDTQQRVLKSVENEINEETKKLITSLL